MENMELMGVEREIKYMDFDLNWYRNYAWTRRRSSILRRRLTASFLISHPSRESSTGLELDMERRNHTKFINPLRDWLKSVEHLSLDSGVRSWEPRMTTTSLRESSLDLQTPPLMDSSTGSQRMFSPIGFNSQISLMNMYSLPDRSSTSALENLTQLSIPILHSQARRDTS